MANVKISELPAASAAVAANEFEINEAGTSKKVTGTQVAAFVEGVVSSAPSFTGQVSLADGSAAAPSLSNTGDLDTGLLFPAADTVGVSVGGTQRLTVGTSGVTVNGGAVFNESSADVDFRIESNGNANMLFVDGGNDTVAIGTSDTDFDPVADNLIVGTGTGSNGITIYTGSSAGNKGSIFFADTAAGDATNSRKGQISYEQNNEIMTFFTADTKAMEIGLIGAVNMPLQPAFLVQPASDQNNIPINATTTVVLGSEVFDQNADFASNTFTAPVTGKYQLNVKINFSNVDVTSDYVNVYLVASNRSVVFTFGSGAGDLDTYQTVAFSTLLDMDASDTAYLYINLPNQGAAQMDVGTDSKFSGYLVA